MSSIDTSVSEPYPSHATFLHRNDEFLPRSASAREKYSPGTVDWLLLVSLTRVSRLQQDFIVHVRSDRRIDDSLGWPDRKYIRCRLLEHFNEPPKHLGNFSSLLYNRIVVAIGPSWKIPCISKRRYSDVYEQTDV